MNTTEINSAIDRITSETHPDTMCHALTPEQLALFDPLARDMGYADTRGALNMNKLWSRPVFELFELLRSE